MPPPAVGIAHDQYPAGAPQAHAAYGSAYGSAPTAAPPAYGPPPAPYAPYGAAPRPAIAGPGGLPMAGIGARFGARLIDGVIVFLAVTLLIKIAFPGAAGILARILFFSVLVGVITAVYEVGMLATRGQTLGKMAVGIRVVGPHGQAPGARSAVFRWGTTFVLQLVPAIGWLLSLGCYLSAAVDPQRRGLHDKAAGTWVVAVRS